MTITCQEMHNALVKCIELRWKPLANGKSLDEVPGCQLCKASLRHIRGAGPEQDSCHTCPLKLTNSTGCGEGSAWREYTWSYARDSRQKAAERMLSELIAAKNHFFPEGWDK